MSDIAKLIGNRIKVLRKEHGWSQEELADRSNINRSYMGEIERGEASATVDTLEKITIAFGITFEDLFRNLQPPSGNSNNTILSTIINKLNTLNKESLEVMLGIFNVLFEQKNDR